MFSRGKLQSYDLMKNRMNNRKPKYEEILIVVVWSFFVHPSTFGTLVLDKYMHASERLGSSAAIRASMDCLRQNFEGIGRERDGICSPPILTHRTFHHLSYNQSCVLPGTRAPAVEGMLEHERSSKSSLFLLYSRLLGTEFTLASDQSDGSNYLLFCSMKMISTIAIEVAVCYSRSLVPD